MQSTNMWRSAVGAIRAAKCSDPACLAARAKTTSSSLGAVTRVFAVGQAFPQPQETRRPEIVAGDARAAGTVTSRPAPGDSPLAVRPGGARSSSRAIAARRRSP